MNLVDLDRRIATLKPARRFLMWCGFGVAMVLMFKLIEILLSAGKHGFGPWWALGYVFVLGIVGLGAGAGHRREAKSPKHSAP